MCVIRLLMLCSFLVICPRLAYSQNTDELSKYIPTENIDAKKRGDKKANRPKRKNYSYLYKRDAYGILYGNPCALEATRKMGFEYVVQSPGVPGSLSEVNTQLNNFVVNLKLIFTRSPFWKLILNKKLKECKQKSGDIVG